MYWQTKLSSNEEIHFPDHLVDKMAQLTDGFSFAYLNEALYLVRHHETNISSHIPSSVSSLIIFADTGGDKPSFAPN